jgi:hypothetical protein
MLTRRVKVILALASSSVGAFLTVWGFINFMLTVTTSALHFGIILGLALLALGISSLRSQREGGRRSRLLERASWLVHFNPSSLLCFNPSVIFIA